MQSEQRASWPRPSVGRVRLLTPAASVGASESSSPRGDPAGGARRAGCPRPRAASAASLTDQRPVPEAGLEPAKLPPEEPRHPRAPAVPREARHLAQHVPPAGGEPPRDPRRGRPRRRVAALEPRTPIGVPPRLAVDVAEACPPAVVDDGPRGQRRAHARVAETERVVDLEE